MNQALKCRAIFKYSLGIKPRQKYRLKNQIAHPQQPCHQFLRVQAKRTFLIVTCR
jgi:hypothetical protein